METLCQTYPASNSSSSPSPTMYSSSSTSPGSPWKDAAEMDMQYSMDQMPELSLQQHYPMTPPHSHSRTSSRDYQPSSNHSVPYNFADPSEHSGPVVTSMHSDIREDPSLDAMSGLLFSGVEYYMDNTMEEPFAQSYARHERYQNNLTQSYCPYSPQNHSLPSPQLMAISMEEGSRHRKRHSAHYSATGHFEASAYPYADSSPIQKGNEAYLSTPHTGRMSPELFSSSGDSSFGPLEGDSEGVPLPADYYQSDETPPISATSQPQNYGVSGMELQSDSSRNESFPPVRASYPFHMYPTTQEVVSEPRPQESSRRPSNVPLPLHPQAPAHPVYAPYSIYRPQSAPTSTPATPEVAIHKQAAKPSLSSFQRRGLSLDAGHNPPQLYQSYLPYSVPPPAAAASYSAVPYFQPAPRPLRPISFSPTKSPSQSNSFDTAPLSFAPSTTHTMTHSRSQSDPISHVVIPRKTSAKAAERRACAVGQGKRGAKCAGISFINYTASDASVLLSGVAPSGSSKRKHS